MNGCHLLTAVIYTRSYGLNEPPVYTCPKSIGIILMLPSRSQHGTATDIVLGEPPTLRGTHTIQSHVP